VNYQVVQPADFSHTIDVRGNIASRTNVYLSSESAGRITQVAVVEGDKVKKGQVLVRLDNEILRNNVAEVKTALELAEAVFERQSALWDKKIGTEIQYLEAKNRKESLERQLATLQSQLAKTVIRAPFTGTADAVDARAGEMAQPGMPLVRVVNQNQMYLEADISERYIGKFNIGDKVSVYFPIQDRTIESQITAISEVINLENRTFHVEFKLPKMDFVVKPNQVVVINLVDYQTDESMIIPTELILTDAQGKFIYTLVNENNLMRATKTRIEVGLSSKGATEVTSGLSAGDMVVLQGYRDLSEGSIVQIATNTTETAKL
jgi:RND family efflux transporter MFP subunit